MLTGSRLLQGAARQAAHRLRSGAVLDNRLFHGERDARPWWLPVRWPRCSVMRPASGPTFGMTGASTTTAPSRMKNVRGAERTARNSFMDLGVLAVQELPRPGGAGLAHDTRFSVPASLPRA